MIEVGVLFLAKKKFVLFRQKASLQSYCKTFTIMSFQNIIINLTIILSSANKCSERSMEV